MQCHFWRDHSEGYRTAAAGACTGLPGELAPQSNGPTTTKQRGDRLTTQHPAALTQGTTRPPGNAAHSLLMGASQHYSPPSMAAVAWCLAQVHQAPPCRLVGPVSTRHLLPRGQGRLCSGARFFSSEISSRSMSGQPSTPPGQTIEERRERKGKEGGKGKEKEKERKGKERKGKERKEKEEEKEGSQQTRHSRDQYPQFPLFDRFFLNVKAET